MPACNWGKKYLQLLGATIRKERIIKGLSQQGFADHADVAKSTIQRIESGEINATILALRDISFTLEIELSELVKED